MAETDRKASAGLRKKAEPAKQKRLGERTDRADLANRFGPSGDLVVALDQYDRYTLLQKDPATGNQTPVYVFIEPNGRDFRILNGTEVVKAIKGAYKNQEALRKLLYEKDYISEKDYLRKDTSAFNRAVLQTATEFSTEIADSYAIEGKIKFPTYGAWMSGKIAVGDGAGDKPRLPSRDINLVDRDVVRALIEDIYMQENMQLPDDPNVINEKVDRYMDMIEKGVVTTYKEKNKKGEYESKTSKGFSEARVRAEVTKEIPKENPEAYQKAQSLNFLSFLAQMEQR